MDSVADIININNRLAKNTEIQEKVIKALCDAKTKKDYQKALVVWLCLLYRISKYKTDSKLINYFVYGHFDNVGKYGIDVAKIHKDFLRQGCNIFTHRGGRRRENMSIQAEIQFLTEVYSRNPQATPREVGDAYAKKLGRECINMSNMTTIYRLIKRHKETIKKICKSKPRYVTTKST